MSGNPDDRAERLAGRWGSAGEDDAGDRSGGGSVDASEQDGGGAGSGGGGSGGEGRGGEGRGGEGRGGEGRGGEGRGGDGSRGVERGDAESGDAGSAGDPAELTTREMQSQMLYLSPEFHRQLDLTYEELDLRFRRERDRRLQKNKDFYAGLLRLGLARLGDAGEQDLDEIEELLGVD